MIIVETPGNDFSCGEVKSVTIKVHASLVNLYTILFSGSVRDMYKRVYRAHNQCLMLNPYIPIIYSWISPNMYYKIVSENFVDELHD